MYHFHLFVHVPSPLTRRCVPFSFAMDHSDGPELPFDIDEQRRHVSAERWREHVLWCERMSQDQKLSLSSRRAAMKILVNEAFQRDIQRCKTDFKRFGVDSLRLTDSFAHCTSPEERFRLELERIRQEWYQVATAVEDDMAHFDLSSLVLKHLSCMCVFIPDSICREYGENAESRRQRVENMRDVISRLNAEGKLFLDEPSAPVRSPQKSASVSPSLVPRGAFFRFEEGTQAVDEEDFGEFVCPPSNQAVAVDLL